MTVAELRLELARLCDADDRACDRVVLLLDEAFTLRLAAENLRTDVAPGALVIDTSAGGELAEV